MKNYYQEEYKALRDLFEEGKPMGWEWNVGMLVEDKFNGEQYLIYRVQGGINKGRLNLLRLDDERLIDSTSDYYLPLPCPTVEVALMEIWFNLLDQATRVKVSIQNGYTYCLQSFDGGVNWKVVGYANSTILALCDAIKGVEEKP